jgi:ankyrin repeat protein
LIRLLLNSGADVNKCDSNGMYPLHHAINRQNDEICSLILEKSMNHINLPDKLGCTPIAYSILNDYLFITDKLLSLNVDVNIADLNGDTPLIKAIWSTMSEKLDRQQLNDIVLRLIRHGADVNAVNLSQRTPLFTAIYQNNTDIALLLIENGANCKMEDPVMNNFTLLHYSCFQGNYTLASKLLENGCNANSVAVSGETPIYIAVTKGYVDIVNLLIDYGADVNVFIGTSVDEECTPLQAAVYYLSDEIVFKKIVDKLIEGGVNLDICKSWPIVFLSLQYNKVNFAKYLVSVGADVEQKTVFNQTCFYLAFMSRNLDFLKLCIMAGFNLNHKQEWIFEYLNNRNLINEFNRDYERIFRKITSEPSDSGDKNQILAQFNGDNTFDDNNSSEEYFLQRPTLYKHKINNLKEYKEARETYFLIKYSTENALSLKQICRIKIRKYLLKKDYKMKFKIKNDLILPKKLKDYLMFSEFNIN